MRVLITGISGFIGYHLAHRLVADGHDVIGVVRKYPNSFSSDFAGISYLAVGDITTVEYWPEKLRGVDAVIHLAARVHVMRDRATDPLHAFRRVNVLATEQLAQAAVAAGVTRFVYISSVKVNGERTSGRPFVAEDAPAPEDPYAMSKLEAEQLLGRLRGESQTEFVTIRPPLVYGPHVRGNLNRLIKLVQKGLPLPLAAIENQRSMVSVTNLVDFVMHCLIHPKAANQTFLVSDGCDWSTPELVSEIALLMGKDPRLVAVPVPLLKKTGRILGLGGVVDRLCDSLQVSIEKNRDLVQWTPVQSKEEALRTTVEERTAG